MYRPPLPADCVRRTELLHLLDDGRSRPLTLVSAPAGYGKSVLVSGWLENSDWPSVWVSLDENDSDLQRFLSYFAAAIREQFPRALETTQSLARSTNLPAPQAVTNILSNELNAIEQPFLLVLDDWHRIHAESAVCELLRTLLDHPPIPLHLVLLTRRDPPLALGRLRGLGQVTEIRMQDLRFSAAETQALLENATHIRASEDAVSNLDRELEGWVAGLRLLTLALRQTPDPDVFMRRFRGGTQQMQEYLISEVLAGLPQPHRAWLLRSALLDRFCAPLCEAVCADANAVETGLITGREFLAYLQTANLFLIPLDAYGHWFRFHHLFEGLLRTELARQFDSQKIGALHQRAGHWLEENGFVEEAVREFAKAGDLDTAAEIVDQHRLDELEKLNWFVVDRWLNVLGPTTTDRPGLRLAEAFVAVRRFDVPRLAVILEEVAPVIENNPEHAHLIGELRCLQGILHYRMGEGETGYKLLLEARDRLEVMEKRGIAGFGALHETLSLGQVGRGKEALAWNEDHANNTPTGDPIYYNLLIAGRVALSYLLGDLARSVNEATRLYRIAAVGDAEYPVSLSLIFRIASELHRGNFEAAVQLSGSVVQRRYSMPLRMAFSAMAALALCHQFLHQERSATRAVGDLLTLALEHNDPAGLATARSCEARIRLLQGDLDGAAKWAGVDDEPPTFADLFITVEVPAITRARVWIAQGTGESLDRACNMIKEASQRAQGWHVTSQRIEADVLQSLALAGLGCEDEALKHLAETLDLAAPGGWLRPFLEPGEPMADLLMRMDTRGLATDFSRQVLGEIKAWLAAKSTVADAGLAMRVTQEESLRETLTTRELDILGLLAKRLQNKEIARELSVSPETVKSHLKNLYAKLGVSSRREAAVRSKAILAAVPAPL